MPTLGLTCCLYLSSLVRALTAWSRNICTSSAIISGTVPVTRNLRKEIESILEAEIAVLCYLNDNDKSTPMGVPIAGDVVKRGKNVSGSCVRCVRASKTNISTSSNDVIVMPFDMMSKAVKGS